MALRHAPQRDVEFKLNVRLIRSFSSSNDISKKGKLRSASRLSSVYTSTSLDTFNFPIIDESTLIALERQRLLLEVNRKKYNQRVGALGDTLAFNPRELGTTFAAHDAEECVTRLFGLSDQFIHCFQVDGLLLMSNINPAPLTSQVAAVND